MLINEQKLDYAFELVKEAISNNYFPCAAVAIGRKDGIFKINHYGNRCICPEVLPIEHNTLFDLASLTKIVGTTTLFMLFLQKGYISVYDKVKDYIKCFEGDGKEDITLFHLLTHTSGLTSHLPFYSICNGYEQTIRYICELRLEYVPGTKVLYSDLGFILLGYILEKVGHDRLDKLCKKYVFEPLQMINTTFNPEGSNIAATEINAQTNKPLVGVVHDDNARSFGGISGHAGLFSNIEDLVKFCNMLINKGKINDNQFISPAVFKTMITNHTKGLNEDRGYGWTIKADKISSGGDIISPKAFGHTGFTGTSIWIDLENNIYIILLTNRVHPSRENKKILRFRRVFHNAVLSSVQ